MDSIEGKTPQAIQEEAIDGKLYEGEKIEPVISKMQESEGDFTPAKAIQSEQTMLDRFQGKAKKIAGVLALTTALTVGMGVGKRDFFPTAEAGESIESTPRQRAELKIHEFNEINRKITEAHAALVKNLEELNKFDLEEIRRLSNEFELDLDEVPREALFRVIIKDIERLRTKK